MNRLKLKKNIIFLNILDAAVNRNSDKENGTIYPVTPTKELGSDISVKHHVSSDSIPIFGFILGSKLILIGEWLQFLFKIQMSVGELSLMSFFLLHFHNSRQTEAII